MLIYLLGCIIFLLCIDVLFNFNPVARLIYKVPNPKRHFIFGHAFRIMLSADELFAFARAAARTFNGIYSLYSFPVSAVNIYNAKDIEILITNTKFNEKGQLYKYVKPWLREGLLLSSGAKWQKRRKILTAAFHFNILQKYFVTMKQNDKTLIEKLKNSCGEPVDLVSNISDYTLNTICETAMGTKMREDRSGTCTKYKEAIDKLMNLLVYRFSHIFLYSDFIYNLTSVGRKQEKCLSIIHNFTRNVIEKRKETFKDVDDTDDVKESEYKYGRRNGNAMLDLLLSVQKEGRIDDAGIKEEVDTFMFEGHGTTAAGITFSLFAIANHPEVQEKIVEELDNIFGDDTREATMEDLGAMRYLDLCVKETMRLYPPVPFIMRKITEPVKLSNYTIPVNTMCLIHIFDLHRNEKYYENPEKFIPERFLPENSIGRHTYAYIPFSAGPRNCIGQKFAIMEMKSVLSSILRHFKLVPVTRESDLCYSGDIVLKTSNPIYVKFLERNKE